MVRALVLLVLALIPSDAGARRLTPSSSSDIIDPLALLSSPVVDSQLQPPRTSGRSDRRIEAILNVEDLTERDHVRQEEERHALNCHKFGTNPNFRRAMAQSDPPEARATDPHHVIAVESETFDEPADLRLQSGATSHFSDAMLASPTLGSSMGSTELHKCVLLSYTNNFIMSKQFKNENTGRMENLALPIFSQTLGVFEIDAIFHDHETLGKDEFYIVIIEAIEHEAGLATCSLKGDPTGAAPRMGKNRKMKPDERDYGATGSVIPKSYRKTWVVHGNVMETDIEKRAELIAAHINDGVNANEDLKDLAEHIKAAEKHIPFNHKLETAKVTFKKCTTAYGQLKCNLETPSVKYLHDMAFTTSSEQHPTFDYVKLSSSLSQALPLDSSPGFLFPVWSSRDGAERAELKGAIDWHTTISSKDRCIPAMKQWLYVGIGTDSLVDLDIGIILYQRQSEQSGGGHKRHLLNWRNGQKWQEGGTGKVGRHWNKAAEYSGDNLSGAGEGDDEWMFLDLSFLKAVGVDVIALMVHSYAGTRNMFATLEGSFARFVIGDASGTTLSDQALKWSGAETVEYVDLDELRECGPPAALIGVLSLEAKSKLVLPEKTIDSLTPSIEKMPNGVVLKYPGDDGVHFNLAIKKYPSKCDVGDCDVGDSACDIEKNVLGMKGPCNPKDHGDLKQPKVKETTPKARQNSLTTVDSAELEQPTGEVLDPLDMLTPPITNNGQEFKVDPSPSGGFQTRDGQHLSGEELLEAAVDQRTSTMTHDDWLHEMLVEFPSGPPGADTLCTESGSKWF